jgi:hypothetical protein
MTMVKSTLYKATLDMDVSVLRRSFGARRENC